MNLSVVIVPAKVLADGTHKIRISISHNSQTRYYVTRFKVPSSKNIKNGKVIGKEVANAEYINQQLTSIIQKMYRAYDSIQNADCYTCSQLLSLIESKMSKTVPTTFGQISEEWLQKKKKFCASGTEVLYIIAINSFKSFALEKYGTKDFLFTMFSPDVIEDFQHYLSTCFVLKKNREVLDGKTKLSTTTINMRMRTLRAIIKYAIDRKYVDFDIPPFFGYKEHPEVVRDLFLKVESIRGIRDAVTWDENIDIVRDIFMLSFYLCGMNLNDLLKLDFSGNEVSFIRGKTSNRRTDGLKTTFTIQPEAREIIDKYIMPDGHLQFKGHTKKSTVSCFIERHLKKLKPFLHEERDTNLIYYCARKTFSQLANELKVQEKVIKYCIGDSLNSVEKDMLNYYTKTIKQMADEAIRSVFDFVASSKSEESLFQSTTPS